MIQIAKHSIIRTLQLYVDYQEQQNFEVCHLNVQNSDTTSPCTPPSAKFIWSAMEVNTHRKINLDHTPQSLDTQQALNKLCEQYKDILFSTPG